MESEKVILFLYRSLNGPLRVYIMYALCLKSKLRKATSITTLPEI